MDKPVFPFWTSETSPEYNCPSINSNSFNTNNTPDITFLSCSIGDKDQSLSMDDYSNHNAYRSHAYSEQALVEFDRLFGQSTISDLSYELDDQNSRNFISDDESLPCSEIVHEYASSNFSDDSVDELLVLDLPSEKLEEDYSFANHIRNDDHFDPSIYSKYKFVFSKLVQLGFSQQAVNQALKEHNDRLSDSSQNSEHVHFLQFFDLITNLSSIASLPFFKYHQDNSIAETCESETKAFTWPVIDMAILQFGEFLLPQQQTECICVLINLPRLDSEEICKLEETIFKLFCKLKKPTSVKIPKEDHNNKSKGIAFVEFESRSTAMEARRAINGLAWSPLTPPILSQILSDYPGSINGLKDQPVDDNLQNRHRCSDENISLNENFNEDLHYSYRLPQTLAEDEEELLLEATNTVNNQSENDHSEKPKSHFQNIEQLSRENWILLQKLETIDGENISLKLEKSKMLKKLSKCHCTDGKYEEALEIIDKLTLQLERSGKLIDEMEDRLCKNEDIAERLRNRLHILTGHKIDSLDEKELEETESLLEKVLVTVRKQKETNIIKQKKDMDMLIERHQEQKLCVVCLSNEKSVLCLPCRHLCICKNCSNHENMDKCPICRKEIKQCINVFA